MPPRKLLFILTIWLIVAPLGAQYNPPGTSVASGDEIDEKELRNSLDEAQWRLGGLRLQPWIGLRDASVVTSSQNDGTDVTASAGAGLRAYLRTGPKVVWAAHALPEYVWWQDDEAKRRLNGRYGLGLFAFFNRLDFEVSARRNETQRFFSAELQELTTTRHDVARLAFELELAERLFVHGSYAHRDVENQEDETPRFGFLDHQTETRRIGLTYRTPRGFSLGGGVEETETDFDREARNLSNTGEATLIEAGYEGRRFGTVLALELRKLEGREGSEFTELETTTGYLESSWSLHRAVDLLVYGRRQLAYSVRNEFMNLLAARAGARLDVRWRDAALYLAAEVGRDDFESLQGPLVGGIEAPERSDDVLAFGMGLAFQLKRTFTLSTALIHTDYDSNLPGFDRDVTAWTASVQLRLLSDRLHLGEGERIW